MINDEITKAPDKILHLRHTDHEMIVLYFQGKLKRTQLSSELEERIEQYRQIAAWAKEYGSRNKVVPMIEKAYGYNFSYCYTLYNDAIRLFSTANSQVEQRDFWVDIWLGETIEALKKAKLKKDFRTTAQLLKQLRDGIKDFFGEKELVDYEKLQPHSITIGFFPSELKTDVPTDRKELDKIIAQFDDKHKIEDAQVVE